MEKKYPVVYGFKLQPHFQGDNGLNNKVISIYMVVVTRGLLESGSIKINPLCAEARIFRKNINTMPADALAPVIDKQSAAITSMG